MKHRQVIVNGRWEARSGHSVDARPNLVSVVHWLEVDFKVEPLMAAKIGRHDTARLTRLCAEPGRTSRQIAGILWLRYVEALKASAVVSYRI